MIAYLLDKPVLELVNKHYWLVVKDIRVAIDDDIITVPANFITDLVSVPRLPLVYMLVGNIGNSAAVVHDYLYTGVKSRAFADEVYLALLKSSGVPAWQRWPMYAAVRALGGRHYTKYNTGEK